MWCDRRVAAWLFVVLLLSCEATSTATQAITFSHMHQQVLDAGRKLDEIARQVSFNALASLSPQAQQLATSAFGKLNRNRENLKEEVGSMVNLVLDWRGVESDGQEPTLYDRMTRMVTTRPDDVYADVSEPTQTTQPQQTGGRRNILGSFRGSILVNEAHCVPAMFMLWVSLFLYGMARNISGSNPSASGQVITPKELAGEFKASVSSQATTFQRFNPSLGSSCLAGNFFMGFAVMSFILAFWFAPPAMRSKLMATALVAIGMAGYLPPEKTDEPMVSSVNTPAAKEDAAMQT